MNLVELARVRAVKTAYEKELLRKPNVVGVGIGLRQRGGKFTNELAIIVSVTHKVPWEDLAPEDRIPEEIEGVPVDVQAIGVPVAHPAIVEEEEGVED
ncbi:MAG: hypothetical protein RMK65_01645 [Anaerolineae bacterium]|nr:hypothetical protein [Anaerolineae bacterium]MCX8066392.1 hypothetical protein [Anaerolineae bacterium]MDW7990848.1 hypothetical protein [Anaerolineae bacterium]